MARYRPKSKPNQDNTARIAAGIALFLLLLAVLLYAEWPSPQLTGRETIPIPQAAPAQPSPTAEPIEPSAAPAPAAEPPPAPAAPAPEPSPDIAPPPSLPAPEIPSVRPQHRAAVSDRPHHRHIHTRRQHPRHKPSYSLDVPCATWQRNADWCSFKNGPWPSQTVH